jgi:exopolysaccharide production protein ExoQ
MPPQLALALGILAIGWLFVEGQRFEPKISKACWLPAIWLFILGSRGVTAWPLVQSLGFSAPKESADSYIEGSPFDRIVFLALIAGGVVVLLRRRLAWQQVIRENKWLFAFFLYLGISVLWSDYPFVSFKRWTKDLGNVVMVLVVLSDPQPLAAVRAVLAGCSYALIVLSIVFIKYFPDIGRYFDRSTWEYHFGGVATDKNMLGWSLFMSAVFLAWNWFHLRKREPRPMRLLLTYPLLLLGILWLFHAANSSTGLGCSLLAIGILLALKLPAIRFRVPQLGWYLGIIVVFLALFDAVFGLRELIVTGLGRDLTLTGRTDIWALVLKEKVNPLIGTGFYSFWLGDRSDRLSQHFFFRLNEAHDGYLETYLNSGWIGLILLVIFLLAAGKRIKNHLAAGDEYADLRLALLISIAFYNVTESAFNRMAPIWFLLLLIVTDYTAGATAAESAQVESGDVATDGVEGAEVESPVEAGSRC